MYVGTTTAAKKRMMIRGQNSHAGASSSGESLERGVYGMIITSEFTARVTSSKTSR